MGKYWILFFAAAVLITCVDAAVISMVQDSRRSTTDPCQQYELVTRAEWKARPPKRRSTIGPTEMAFIHHSAGPECSDKARCAELVRGIQKYHMAKGWSDIGYNFLVGGDGRVYEGRGWQVMGAHAIHYNSVSHGICILGNYMGRMPTQAAITAAVALMECGVNKGHIKGGYELFGHRDGYCTKCPGNVLYKDLQSWPHYSHRKIHQYCSTEFIENMFNII